MRRLLLPCSWLYGLIVRARNRAYDKGILGIERVSVPVISVGNLTSGGSGKTPFVEYLVEYCLGAQKKVAVLSRGYKRSTRGTVVVSDGERVTTTPDRGGDEPFQIARRFPGAVVIADERRTRSARIAVDRFHVDVIVLDDGFQHRALDRDLDILMLDGGRSVARMAMLPAGDRREPLSSLRRADLLVRTSRAGSAGRRDDFSRYASAPEVAVRFKPASLRSVFGEELLLPESAIGQPVVACCGIANPRSFEQTLGNMGMEVRAGLAFPDHHWFTVPDLRRIQETFERSAASMILTTEKDAVRISALRVGPSFRSLPWYFVRLETEIIEGESELHSFINSVLRREYAST